MSIDLYIFNLIHQFAGKLWPLDWLGILGAKYLAYFLVIAALYFLLRLKTSRGKLFFLSFASLSALLSRGFFAETIRFFYIRPRPFESLDFEPLIAHQSGGSFPSGHAALFFALAFALFYFNKKWGWWFLALSLFMGLARVFAGVHYPSDILGGIAVAAVSVFLVSKMFYKDMLGEILDNKPPETLDKALEKAA